jgi:L-malate glycosyltransferase
VKVPHLCHVFPTFGTGGPEVRTARLINALGDAYRHTVISLSGERSGVSRLERPEQVRVLDAPPRRGRLRFPRALGTLLRSLEPDLILTYGWGGTDAILGAWLCGLKRVIHAEDGFLSDERYHQKLARRLARCVLLRLASRVICPSLSLVRVARHSWCLPAHQVNYLPNGIDTTHFIPATPDEAAAAQSRLGIPPDSVVVGTVGMIRPEKNHLRLLRAFAAVAANRPARLLIVGDGPLREDLLIEAASLGVADRVHFPGVLEDPLAAYQALDVFALSSDTEQMPLALLEAMAVGLPAVSTEVGDVKAMLPAANQAYVTPLGQEQAFQNALAALIDGAEERDRLGRENRIECAKQFDVVQMTRAYDLLYRSVLGGGTGQVNGKALNKSAQ